MSEHFTWAELGVQDFPGRISQNAEFLAQTILEPIQSTTDSESRSILVHRMALLLGRVTEVPLFELGKKVDIGSLPPDPT